MSAEYVSDAAEISHRKLAAIAGDVKVSKNPRYGDSIENRIESLLADQSWKVAGAISVLRRMKLRGDGLRTPSACDLTKMVNGRISPGARTEIVLIPPGVEAT